jgi:hypothetical protein
MICENYSELSPLERVMFIGELTHACMADDDLFNKGKELIRLGIEKGIFENVKIMPEIQEEINETEIL